MENFPGELEVCPHCGYIVDSQVEEAIHIVPGSLLHDRYIVGKVLGYGSFGVTYIAWDGKLERKVAIKEYMPSEFSTRMPGQSCLTVFGGDKSEQFQDGLKKFVDEAKRLAKFNNEPGIVSIFDSFLENDTAYIVMEYLDGETLGDRLKREKVEIKGKNGTEIRSLPIPEDEAVSLLLPVMNSLITVHKEGIIHRDIAPDNIFITKEGNVKLIDFGASRYATTSHSRSLTTIVKPGYSPKEQYDSRGDQGPHTDVYALAATLYKMITGKTPPEAMGRNAICETKHRDPLIEPHKIVKNISEVTENAILNALNIRIEDRTPDVETFINELSATVPAKRKYGKIKKIDLYNWPLWMKITVPVIATLMVTFGALVLTGVIKFNSLFSDKVVVPDGMVSVPDVENLDKDEAISKIESTKLLAVAGGNVESEYVEAGIIVLQTPDGGSFADINSEVKLIVSSGVGVVEVKDGIATVPYVVWNTQDEAVAKLKQAGLSEPIVETKSDDNVEAGRVISQSKSSGEKVPEGTQITIVVSTGAASFDMINVVGKPLSDAKSSLEKKALKVNVSYEKNSSVSEGTVISQSIAAGKKVKKGDAVTLKVSSGKPLVTVANVVGKTQSTATQALEKQGFKISVSYGGYSSNTPYGSVLSQSPAAGTSQIEGFNISLVLSKGPDWSSYTGTLPSAVNSNDYEIRYQYRDKIPYSESSSSSVAPNKSGYTYVNTTSALGDYGSWSSWGTEYPENITGRQIDPKTQYGYYHYKLYFWDAEDNVWRWGYYPITKDQYNNSSVPGLRCTKMDSQKIVWVDSELKAVDTLTYGVTGKVIAYEHICNDCEIYVPGPGDAKRANYLYSYGARTVYRYRDRQTIYTHNYYSWGSWTKTNSLPSSNSNREIQYSYRRK
ncbi:MAG: serine/threonine-protein kinase [Clostridia bacterium]|nr:serine/threonine-protein kinase [Clostridia bacterium]